ncbi:MAG: alternative ribosome rescue aminoacyl-tRNA hydrolase ArfB [bacterium]
MKNDLPVKNSIVIPGHELEISTSRSGGAGGQHVNKTDTRITARWNVKKTTALNEEQKERVLQNLQTQLTKDGDLIIHSNATRSQLQNKQMALERMAKKIAKAMHVPKKRMKTRIPKKAKESRLQVKKHRGEIKKMRGKKIQYE